jgi:hypothetical protein
VLPDAEEGYELPAAAGAAGRAQGLAQPVGDLTTQATWPASCAGELQDGTGSRHWGRQVGCWRSAAHRGALRPCFLPAPTCTDPC